MWLLFSWFPISLQGTGLTQEFRIVGGRDAKPGEFPYIVSIQVNAMHNCGGSIISDEWILSAAHCFPGINEPFHHTVVTGTVELYSEGKRHWVKKIVNHPLYNKDTYDNDIALLQLRNTILFDSSTYKINLPTRDTPIGTKVVLSGWGLTSYKPIIKTATLKTLSLLIITNQKCQEDYNRLPEPIQVTEERICTFTKKGEGACFGDSGGPLVDPNLNSQVGITSYGIPCADGIPDIFTRIYKHLDWINDEMNQC